MARAPKTECLFTRTSKSEFLCQINTCALAPGMPLRTLNLKDIPMTSNDITVLHGNLETLRSSLLVDDTRDLDRRPANAANFNDARYLDTRPALHMTATWGN